MPTIFHTQPSPVFRGFVTWRQLCKENHQYHSPARKIQQPNTTQRYVSLKTATGTNIALSKHTTEMYLTWTQSEKDMPSQKKFLLRQPGTTHTWTRSPKQKKFTLEISWLYVYWTCCLEILEHMKPKITDTRWQHGHSMTSKQSSTENYTP